MICTYTCQIDLDENTLYNKHMSEYILELGACTTTHYVLFSVGIQYGLKTGQHGMETDCRVDDHIPQSGWTLLGNQLCHLEEFNCMAKRTYICIIKWNSK